MNKNYAHLFIPLYILLSKTRRKTNIQTLMLIFNKTIRKTLWLKGLLSNIINFEKREGVHMRRSGREGECKRDLDEMRHLVKSELYVSEMYQWQVRCKDLDSKKIKQYQTETKKRGGKKK